MLRKVWSGSISVRSGFMCEYSYYVVDDECNILRFEVGKKRKLVLPDGVRNGQFVELRDLWQEEISIFVLYQNGSDRIPFTSAFKNVIFRRSLDLKVERLLEAPELCYKGLVEALCNLLFFA